MVAIFHEAQFDEVDTENLDRWLTSHEIGRLEHLKAPNRRTDWLTGRWTAKILIQTFLNDHEEQNVTMSDIEIIPSDRGSPVISILDHFRSDLSLSISHSEGHAYAGISQISQDGWIGVDLEKIRELNPKLHQRVLSVQESRFVQTHFPNDIDEGLLKIWSMKEAAFKAVKPLHDVHKNSFEIDAENGLARMRKPSALTLNAVSAQSERRGEFLYARALMPSSRLAI